MGMDSMAIMDLVSTTSLGTNFSIIMDTDLGTNLSTVSENTDARTERPLMVSRFARLTAFSFRKLSPAVFQAAEHSPEFTRELLPLRTG
jgi:hypothetical protein